MWWFALVVKSATKITTRGENHHMYFSQWKYENRCLVHPYLVPTAFGSDSETHICRIHIPRLKILCCLKPLRRIWLLKIFLSCGCFIDMHRQVQGHYPKAIYSLSDISGSTSSDPVVRRHLTSEIRYSYIRVGFFYSQCAPNQYFFWYTFQSIQDPFDPFFTATTRDFILAAVLRAPWGREIKIWYPQIRQFKRVQRPSEREYRPRGPRRLKRRLQYWVGSTGRPRSQTKVHTWYDENATMGGSSIWPEGREYMTEFRSPTLEY